MECTIPNFLHHIGSSNFASNINKAYDHTMALYSLIGATEVSNINMNRNNSVVEYNVELPSEMQACVLNNTYNNRSIFTCGRAFYITTDVSGSNINIRIQ